MVPSWLKGFSKDNDNIEEQILEILQTSDDSGKLNSEERKMISAVFAFDDIVAYEIMTPRTDVFAIDIDADEDSYISELMKLKYTRIPVYEEDSDNIIGVLNIKDYLKAAWEQGNFTKIDIKKLLREPYCVPETKNIADLFVDMQRKKQHMVILIDEYGGFSGLVTMEDIVEEIMGDIDDEYDEQVAEIQEIAADEYMVGGSIDLDDLNEELELTLESESSETIGGFLLDMLGEIPAEDARDDEKNVIEYGNCIFTIESVKDRRIELVRLKILPPPASEYDEIEES